MSYLTLILAGILLLALAAIIFVLFFKKPPLNKAHAALIGILCGMVAGISAPSAEGEADIDLYFGFIGHITAKYVQINPPESLQLWIPAFLCISILIGFIIYCLHTQKMAGL